METDSNSDRPVIREMDGPAPKSEVTPHRFWILEVAFNLFCLLVVGSIIAIRENIAYLFKKKKSIKGKVVLITGTGRGLGRDMALKMSKLGAHIACVDINTKSNDETVRLIRQEGGKAEGFTVNVAKSQQVEQLYKDVTNKLGHTDVIVNNAALVMAVPIDEMSYDDIRGFYEVNSMASVFMTKTFLPEMKKRNSGHIVGISSVAARTKIPWLTLYGSTKAALTSFFDSLRVELSLDPNNKISLTTIHPFFVNTTANFTKWFRLKTPILEVDTVVDAIINAILYEEQTVFVPRIFSMLQLLDALTPQCCHALSIKYFSRHFRVPSKNERDSLPYAAIVNETSSEKNK